MELEVVRNRAAELIEQAADERRRVAEERSQWAGELRQLRRALEIQTQQLGEKERALHTGRSAPPVPLGHAPAGASPIEARPAAAASAADPVLDAVRAQFQRLQQERIQRHAGKGKGRQEVA